MPASMLKRLALCRHHCGGHGGSCPDHSHDHGHDHHDDDSHGHDHHHDHGHGHGHGRPRPAKPGILLAAFGVAIPDARAGYEAMDREVRERFPGVAVRWAYTAHKIRRKLAARGFANDSVAVALSKLHDEGVTHLAVQSLHTVPGVEYHWTLDQARVFRHPRKGFPEVEVGGPMLMAAHDLDTAAEALAGYLPAERGPDDAVVLVGHGTYHEGHRRYLDFESLVRRSDPLLFMGTLMGKPGCDAIIERVRESGAKRVWLLPFMSAPGHHVRVDIAGEGPGSWKNRMASAGFDVRTCMTGTIWSRPAGPRIRISLRKEHNHAYFRRCFVRSRTARRRWRLGGGRLARPQASGFRPLDRRGNSVLGFFCRLPHPRSPRPQ
ncbi:MAG: sirohydrochlorin cobaltochelatase [Oceanidesulfovibrio sp.]